MFYLFDSILQPLQELKLGIIRQTMEEGLKWKLGVVRLFPILQYHCYIYMNSIIIHFDYVNIFVNMARKGGGGLHVHSPNYFGMDQTELVRNYGGSAIFKNNYTTVFFSIQTFFLYISFLPLFLTSFSSFLLLFFTCFPLWFRKIRLPKTLQWIFLTYFPTPPDFQLL